MYIDRYHTDTDAVECHLTTGDTHVLHHPIRGHFHAELIGTREYSETLTFHCTRLIPPRIPIIDRLGAVKVSM